MKLMVKALRDDRAFDLQLDLVGGEAGLGREITHPRIKRPGLALAGFLPALRRERVHVLGKTEVGYLDDLDAEARARAIRLLFSSDVACLVLTNDYVAGEDLRDAAEQHGKSLFVTQLASGDFVRRVHDFLDAHLSSETSMHGVLVDVFGVGVLLVGPSGVGKSECALDLVLRGHRLVSDDVVVVRRQGQRLIGQGSPLTLHHMEVRGLGIINEQDLFGAASVRERKILEMLVEFSEWSPHVEFDRLGIDELHEEILEVRVPKIKLPIRPGRNMASIVEVAARNHLLKLRGHHSARAFKARLEQRLGGITFDTDGTS